MKIPPRSIRPPSQQARRAVLFGLFFFAIFLVPALIRLLTEWPWFQGLGFARVFVTRLTAGAVLGLSVAVVAFIALYANLRLALRGVELTPRLVQITPAGPVELMRLVRRVLRPAVLLVAVMMGVAAAGSWLDVLRFINQVPFGTTDPVFGRDIAYYIFTLPIISGALRLLTILTTIALAASVVLYVLRRDIAVFGRNLTVEPRARLHLAVLVATMFVLTALRVYLVHIPDLLQSSTGPLVGASFADLHGSLPGLRLAALAALVGAGVVLWSARGPRLGHATLLALGIYLGTSVIGVNIYPSIIHRFVVAPNELAKEAPQLERHIEATREAWGLDSVLTRDLTGEAHLTETDIKNNRATIDNIRLWDRDPLLQTFGQLQEIRTYYDFLSVDDDRYWIDGRYRQVMLSPRELNTASLPTRTFINERLTFTHGMGLTLGPVNQVTSEGLPVLFIKDLPPVSSVSINVTRPEIYYGEITDAWVFANTGQREFDYPSGDDNVYASYEGDGGVRVGSLARRLLFAAYFRSMKVLLSSDITNDSRAMFNRNIRVRARKLLPFLAFDSDPYMVIDEAGRLKWILDAYTSARRYPYAQPLRGGTNYLRNSVKVVIDAYDGKVTAYLADPNDPLVLTLANVFPGIFKPLDEMPADLRAHLRYPELLFEIQSDLYATYHMDEAETFYHREDQWQKPVLTQEGTTRDPFLRHIIMRLPGEKDAEFIFMVPFTPRGKDNLASWMVARNDGQHYGQLVVYRLPKQSLVFGPTQIVNRMNQDTEISRQISLWDQRGSEVIRGHLLVIPIEESLIYVQPVYLRAEGGRIPELKRVIVAYQNRVVMEETLEEGLMRLFGGTAEAASAGRPAAPDRPLAAVEGANSTAQLASQARELYQRAIAAQREGDWAGYGEELQRLGEILKQLEASAGGD
ncbi:MAG: UPF0182 family protein [Candidatus Krumholzibacteria bacterium]|nr:UPF0182 family protein [Candidatus Krumholzibacteria bacterium]MDH4338156.1 UPF0182 family protein [Candidatus Krumholzibacteria bacterium]